MASKLISKLKLLQPQTLKVFSSRFHHSLGETNVSSLTNGLRVASEASGGEICTVGIWLDAGSRYEHESKNGITNFVEHMIFKGTQNRSQLQFETEVENIGAQFNAYTSRELTAYYAKCLKKDLPAVVNLLGDAVQNPLFDEEAIEKQRNVILRQLHALDSDLNEVLIDHLHATAYQGTSLEMSVVGTSENVNSISKTDLHDYVNTTFTTPRMAVAAAGGVDHDELVKLVDENFTNFALVKDLPEVDLDLSNRFSGSVINDRNDDEPLAHVAFAVEGCGLINPDFFVLEVAKSIIGNWNKTMVGAKYRFGALSSQVSGEGIGQSYSVFNTCYSDTGLFGAQFVTDPLNIDEMVIVLQNELIRLATSASDAEVARAKQTLLTSIAQGLDTTSNVCDTIGRQMIAYNRRMSFAEVSQRINMITAKQVRHVMMEYAYDADIAIAAVGPTESLTDYNRARSGMYHVKL